MPRNLDLALIGNGAIGLLVDATGAVVWGCFPRFDGDADVLCAARRSGARRRAGHLRRRNPRFRPRRAVLLQQHGRPRHAPVSIRRAAKSRSPTACRDSCSTAASSTRCPMCGRIRRVAGSPRIRVRLRPAVGYGRAHPAITVGSSHIRYVMPGRDAAAHHRRVADRDPRGTAVLPRAARVTLLLGPDETVPSAVGEVGRRFLEETIDYWRDWVRGLASRSNGRRP